MQYIDRQDNCDCQESWDNKAWNPIANFIRTNYHWSIKVDLCSDLDRPHDRTCKGCNHKSKKYLVSHSIDTIGIPAF
jgi:hypothetical protein